MPTSCVGSFVGVGNEEWFEAAMMLAWFSFCPLTDVCCVCFCNCFWVVPIYCLFIFCNIILLAIDEVRRNVWYTFVPIIGGFLAVPSHAVVYSVFGSFVAIYSFHVVFFHALTLVGKVGAHYMLLNPDWRCLHCRCSLHAALWLYD